MQTRGYVVARSFKAPMVIAILAIALAICPGAIASAAKVRLLHVGGSPNYITYGPDHAAWFTALNSASRYGRVTRHGQVTHYLLPRGEATKGIASGRGYVWITACCPSAIFRITPYSGRHHRFRAPDDAGKTVDQPTIGPDGAIWFTESYRDRLAPAAIGRMTTDGKFSKYELPSHRDHRLGAIASGRGNSLWFLDDGKDYTSGAVWRVTTDGRFSRFRLLPRNPSLMDLAVGGGSAWVIEARHTTEIVRFSNGGARERSYHLTDAPTAIVRGRDSAMWFSNPSDGRIGRIGFNGKIRYYDLPYAQGDDLDIASNHDVWYSDSLGGEIGVLTP